MGVGRLGHVCIPSLNVHCRVHKDFSLNFARCWTPTAQARRELGAFTLESVG